MEKPNRWIRHGQSSERAALRSMRGYTLDTMDEPEEPTLVESIDEELRRLSDSASGYPYVHPKSDGDPGWLIRAGDDETSVLCYAFAVLDMLKQLPDGAPLGQPHGAPDGSVWAVLHQAASRHTRGC